MILFTDKNGLQTPAAAVKENRTGHARMDMNEINGSRPFAALLEQMKGAAVAVTDGVVRDFNGAASALLPGLRVGCALKAAEDGKSLLLCGEKLEGAAIPLTEATIYVLAAPAGSGQELPPGLADRVSAAMIDALSPSFLASSLLAEALEKDETATEHIAILRHNQFRLLHLAHNLQLLGRLNAGERLKDPVLFDLAACCVETARLAEGVLRPRGIELQYSSEGADFAFFGDRELLVRVLLDLIANGAAHCAEGGAVRLELTQRGEGFLLSVSDSGGGVSGEAYRQIVSPFARQEEADAGRSGAGLSIAVARGVIERHGGSLAIESRPGEGTRVSIRLPAPEKGKELHSSPISYGRNNAALLLETFSALLSWHDYAPPFL